MYDHIFPSLVASLFPRRSLVASTSSFLHAGITLHPLSVTVSTHTSASNAFASQPPATPRCRSVRSRFTFLLPTRSSPHCTLRVSQLGLFWQPPAVHSDKHPRPQTSSSAQRRLNAFKPDYLKGTVIRGHLMVWSLALCPDDASRQQGTSLDTYISFA